MVQLAPTLRDDPQLVLKVNSLDVVEIELIVIGAVPTLLTVMA